MSASKKIFNYVTGALFIDFKKLDEIIKVFDFDNEEIIENLEKKGGFRDGAGTTFTQEIYQYALVRLMEYVESELEINITEDYYTVEVRSDEECVCHVGWDDMLKLTNMADLEKIEKQFEKEMGVLEIVPPTQQLHGRVQESYSNRRYNNTRNTLTFSQFINESKRTSKIR